MNSFKYPAYRYILAITCLFIFMLASSALRFSIVTICFCRLQLQQKIVEAHANVKDLSLIDAKMHYIRAWQALPEYGVHYFIVKFKGARKQVSFCLCLAIKLLYQQYTWKELLENVEKAAWLCLIYLGDRMQKVNRVFADVKIRWALLLWKTLKLFWSSLQRNCSWSHSNNACKHCKLYVFTAFQSAIWGMPTLTRNVLCKLLRFLTQ